MFVPVCITQEPDGYAVWAPDLPDCHVRDPDQDRALTRIHLKLEGAVSDLLIRGEDIPGVSTIDLLRKDAEYADSALTLIHINETHLRAVARHQTRFGEPDAQ